MKKIIKIILISATAILIWGAASSVVLAQEANTRVMTVSKPIKIILLSEEANAVGLNVALSFNGDTQELEAFKVEEINGTRQRVKLTDTEFSLLQTVVANHDASKPSQAEKEQIKAANSKIYTTQFNPSDIRLKNITGNYNYGLDQILQINPVRFTFKENNALGITDPGEHIGIVAQDLQQVIPEAVSTNTQGYLQFNIEPVIWASVNAIKTQQAQINSLSTALSLDSEGYLKVPKLKTDKLTISAGINLTPAQLDSNLVYQTTTNPSGDTNYSVDVLASLGSISQAILGINTTESTTSAQLANLQTQVATTSASLSTAIASQSATTQTLAQQLASASAELVKTKSDLDLLKLTPPDLLLATGPATLASLAVSSDASISGKLTAYQATISDTFKSLGGTFLGNTTIAGDLTVDGTMSVTGSSINTLSTLFIQNSPLATLIDFFNGQATIDKTGKLTVQKIVLPPEVLGEATIPTGEVEIPIFTTAVTDKSKIFLTPLSSLKGQNLIISSIVPESKFVVTLETPVDADIKFNWLILDNK